MGHHVLAGSGIKKMEENKQETEKRCTLEYAIGMLMQENLSIQSCYHTYSLTNSTHLATYPDDLCCKLCCKSGFTVTSDHNLHFSSSKLLSLILIILESG